MNKVIKLSGVLSLIFVATSAVAVAPAQVPATGEIGGGTGSNKGVALPSPRFVAGTGATADCITDKLTGLMWPKNGIIGFEATNGGGPIAQPNYVNTDAGLNQLPWAQALTAIGNMNTAPIKLCGYSDWRFSNKLELSSLVNYGQSDSAAWLNTQGFSNVVSNAYWSSSTRATNTNNAWSVVFNTNYISAYDKVNGFWILPVRGGQ